MPPGKKEKQAQRTVWEYGKRIGMPSQEIYEMVSRTPQVEIYRVLFDTVFRSIDRDRSATAEDKIAMKQILDLLRVYAIQTPLPLWKVSLLIFINGLPKSIEQLDELIRVTAKKRKAALISGELIADLDKSDIVSQITNYTELLLQEAS